MPSGVLFFELPAEGKLDGVTSLSTTARHQFKLYRYFGPHRKQLQPRTAALTGELLGFLH